MEYAAARRNMVENQIRSNRVTDPLILSAMLDLPRQAFVPDHLKGIAYIDGAINLGDERFLMEPLLMARLLQAAQVMPDDVVLDIGCATGYASAILAGMASTVVALESDPALAARANEILMDLGMDNVAVVGGALEDGYSKQGPYDVIFINGAVLEIPSAITSQLAEGGRLVGLVSGRAIGKGRLVTRHGGDFSERDILEAATPSLPGFAKREEAVFAL